MSLKDLIRSDYKEYIAMFGHQFPTELIRSLKHHERVPVFVDNLSKQLQLIERRKKIRLDRVKVKDIVYDMTKNFLTLLNRRADEMAMSDLEKRRLVMEEAKRHSVGEEEAAEIQKELEHDKVITVDYGSDVK